MAKKKRGFGVGVTIGVIAVVVVLGFFLVNNNVLDFSGSPQDEVGGLVDDLNELEDDFDFDIDEFDELSEDFEDV